MFDVEIWLHAVSGKFDDDELRAYYKANETPTLDRALAASPSLRLGNTEVITPDNQTTPGPVGRVVDLLSLKGTESWPPRLPSLDEALEREILEAFAARLGDPAFDAVPDAALQAFLSENRGLMLATRSDGL
jgi:hypothetical protein